MSTPLLPRRCLSCLRTTRKLRYRPLAVNHGHIQWFSTTRIWAQHREEAESVVTKASFEGKFGTPFYQGSILSRRLSLFSSGSFKLPRLTRHLAHRTPLLVLFVTPSLSNFLDEDSSFLQHVLRCVFSTLEVDREFDLLVAVVDSVPHVPKEYLKAIGADIPHNHGLGSDGISLLLCESHRTAPDLWSPRQESQERESMDIQQRSTISFSYEPPEAWRQWAAERFPPLIYTTHSLELPLANTMFHNGQTSTMFAQRWTVMQKGENPEFKRVKQTSLTQQTLNLTRSIGEGELSVRLPLVPITVPRRVTAAMGNIIRRIQTGDTPEEQVPASEELEKDIHNYFARFGSPEKRIGVWALVTPQEIWTSQPQSTREKRIFSYIEDGARLHKVLSGGGGWGIKQGLLSLDPHSSYSRSDQASEPTIEDDGDLEAEKHAVLGEVVKPGDVVQFFIYREMEAKHGQTRDLSETQVLFDPVHGFRTTIFGTIPSTRDAMPEPLPTKAEKDGESPHMLIHTHFGALSEQGMSLKVTTHNARNSDSTAPIGARRLGTVVQTKLDVPHARFGWVPSEAMFQKHLAHLLALPKTRPARIRRVELYDMENQLATGARLRRWMVPVLPPSAEKETQVRRDGQADPNSAGLGSGVRDGRGEEDGVPVFEEGDMGYRLRSDGSGEGKKRGEAAAPVGERRDELDRPFSDLTAYLDSSERFPGGAQGNRIPVEGDTASPIPTVENEGAGFRIRRHMSWGPLIKGLAKPEDKQEEEREEERDTGAMGVWDQEGEAGAEVEARLVQSWRPPTGLVRMVGIDSQTRVRLERRSERRAREEEREARRRSEGSGKKGGSGDVRKGGNASETGVESGSGSVSVGGVESGSGSVGEVESGGGSGSRSERGSGSGVESASEGAVSSESAGENGNENVSKSGEESESRSGGEDVSGSMRETRVQGESASETAKEQ